MNFRDRELIEGVRDYLGLKNRVYVYDHSGKDEWNRKPYASLVVRDIDGLKNKITPFFYNRLVGYKAIQFDDWLEVMGNDILVPERYNIIYRLHKNGYYTKNPYLD